MLLAIALMLIVAVLPSILFPPEQVPRREVLPPDTVFGREPGGAPVIAAGTVATEVSVLPVEEARVTAAVEAKPVVVSSPIYHFEFSPRGAQLSGATLLQYRSFVPGDSGYANVIPEGADFLTYSLLLGADTVPLRNWLFEPSDDSVIVGPEGAALTWVARRGGVQITLQYRFQPDRYVFDVAGRIDVERQGGGVGGEAGLVLVGLGPRLKATEVDTAGDFRSYGVVTKARSTENLKFSSLDPGERKELPGPFEWVAIKSTYFVAAILTIAEGEPRLGGAVATGGMRTGKFATNTRVEVTLPAPGGRFGHSVYVGPQEYRRLARIGHDLTEVNPYGWILRPVIQPFTILIVKILLWMHENLRLAYGWVLIVFGIAVRLLLWPLNQKAMRSSVAMQALQPEIKALQQQYKGEPQKMQQELMKLYKQHGVNPLGGCLPMLLPMPVLFALFFVFQNTIELRGASFLWLPDLARPDPLFVIPVVMGVSMYVLFKIGQIGVPPNPQSKMMMYLMPGMFLVIGIKFPAGLNLYYAVSNIASLPQQWLIARQRLRRTGKSGS